MNIFTPQRSTETIKAELLDLILADNPTLYDDLPASLVDALVLAGSAIATKCETARGDVVNALGDIEALEAMGAGLGIFRKTPRLASVIITFSGIQGLVIPQGTIVTNASGSHRYQVVTGGSIDTGSSIALYCQGIDSYKIFDAIGSLQTMPTPVAGITANNLQAVIVGDGNSESDESLRSRIMAAYTSMGLGFVQSLKTEIQKINDVPNRLVSVFFVAATNSYKLIVGGGDRAAIAAAVYRALPDPAILTASANATRNVSVTVVDDNTQNVINYILPAEQKVELIISYSTSQLHDSSALITAAKSLITDYINNIQCSQPLSMLLVQDAFKRAADGFIDTKTLSRIDILTYVTISNGTATLTSPNVGAELISGHSEGLWLTQTGWLTVAKA